MKRHWTILEEQAGFEPVRGCTDNIATLRIIVEHRAEWQSIDMKASDTVDSVGREVLWKLFRHYEIPVKTVPIIRGGPQGFQDTLDWLSRTQGQSLQGGVVFSGPGRSGFP